MNKTLASKLNSIPEGCYSDSRCSPNY